MHEVYNMYAYCMTIHMYETEDTHSMYDVYNVNACCSDTYAYCSDVYAYCMTVDKYET